MHSKCRQMKNELFNPFLLHVGMIAHETNNNASHIETDDVDMRSNIVAENDLKEPAPSTPALQVSNNAIFNMINDIFSYEFHTIKLSLIQNFPPNAGNKGRMPAAPAPYIKATEAPTSIVVSDDEEPGPSTSAIEVSYKDFGL